jgi:hypothetical protein
MGAPRCFTGRKEHRRGDLVHFAEVTVQAEPCLGESAVVLSEEALDTLREAFGPDSEHHIRTPKPCLPFLDHSMVMQPVRLSDDGAVGIGRLE